jgi:NAD+ kinase
MAAVLVVAKTPTAQRLSGDDLGRLVEAGAASRDLLLAAADRHRACLAAVRLALARDQVREIAVEDLAPADGRGSDLVVTVGGDGTVFTANTLATDAPFLTVNSDPDGSVGTFTRCRMEALPELLAAWRDGRAGIEELPRLSAETPAGRHRFLNDCLVTSRNPAAMTRYVLATPEGREAQRSSGVWLATAAGSTGAIRSAGAAPVPRSEPALLFRVREPFHGRGALHLLSGCQQPPQHCTITTGMVGCALYLDGPNIAVPLRPGEDVRFAPAAAPLRLVVPR